MEFHYLTVEAEGLLTFLERGHRHFINLIFTINHHSLSKFGSVTPCLPFTFLVEKQIPHLFLVITGVCTARVKGVFFIGRAAHLLLIRVFNRYSPYVNLLLPDHRGYFPHVKRTAIIWGLVFQKVVHLYH